MPIYLKIVAFVVLLGGLVFVHELGHFLAAKFFHVKVLKFSLGFGNRLWGFRRGETEYQIAALPLGGYVKMAGDDPTAPVAPEDQGRGFLEQKPYKRAIIAFAGPAVNLLLPPLVFCLINMTPRKTFPPVVGLVLPNEPAERAGIKPGDRVISVDGIATPSYEEMHEEIESRPGRDVDLLVDRHGQHVTLHVTPAAVTENDGNIIKTTVGRIGVVIGKIQAHVGVVEGSRADKAGLRDFDQIVSLNGQPVASAADLESKLKVVGDGPLTLGVVRGEPVDLKTASIATARTLTITIPPGTTPLGIDRPDLYVREVSPDSQVHAQGMRPGDKVVAIDGVHVESGIRLEQLMSGKKKMTLTLERGPKLLTVTFSPVTYERHDPVYGPIPEVDNGFYFYLNAYAMEPFAPSEMVTVKDGPVRALTRGANRTVMLTRRMVLGIAGLFEGKVSVRTIGGPIQIAQLASVYADNGFEALLELFAIISINLGLINLIPIPVLDGFHIVISGIEGISRRPVPVRARIIAQYVGVAMVLMLMVLAFGNDIVRVFGQ